MGESYELEEGEFKCSANVDLDLDLSYIVSLHSRLLVFFPLKIMFPVLINYVMLNS